MLIRPMAWTNSSSTAAVRCDRLRSALRSANGSTRIVSRGDGFGSRPRTHVHPATAASRTTAKAATLHSHRGFGGFGGNGCGAPDPESGPAGSNSTGARNRYPLRGTVST
jgi:hypothetical protein